MVFAQLQDNWQALRTELFPSTVVMQLSDQQLTAQRLPDRFHAQEEAWVVQIPGATLRQGQPVEIEALGDFIGDLLLMHGEIKARLVVALPAVASRWRVLEGVLPPTPREALALLRQTKPDLGLSFDLEAAYLDLMALGGDQERTLLVAMQRDLLLSWLQVFDIAGVRVERLVPLQVAVMAALGDQLLPADASALVALLLPEQLGVRLLVWRNGVPLYEQLLEAAPVRLAQQLTQCLHFLQWQQAGLASDAVELLLAEAQDPTWLVEFEHQLEQQLGLKPRIPNTHFYGSLVLQGLAALESQR